MPSAELPVLIVDDDPETRRSLEAFLSSTGIRPIVCLPDGEAAVEFLERGSASILILDINMPGMGGLAVLEWTLARRPEIPVIVVTGSGEVSLAVSCMKRGAYDFFAKPAEPEALVAAARRAMEKRRLDAEARSLSSRFLEPGLRRSGAFSAIVTNAPGMTDLFRYMEAVAESPEAVLIRGDSGTGKELFARALHGLSGLPGEFVAVNLAGLDDAFFSDTLFGHRKGAFTGAADARPGLIEKAAEGTLFLDEIGDLAAASQVKLLRLLQEGEYFRLGSDSPSPSRARIIAATHRDLDKLVAEGAFRLDLFYRLSAHGLRIPRLGERRGDIALLAQHFVEEAARVLKRPPAAMPPEALEALASHDYPGNVRELRSLVFDAFCNQSDGRLSAEFIRSRLPALPVSGSSPPGGHERNEPAAKVIFPGSLPKIKEVGDLLVEEALRRAGGNQSRAARLIGISHQALSKRLKG